MKVLLIFYFIVMLLIFVSIGAQYIKVIKSSGGFKGNSINVLKGAGVSIVVSFLWFPLLIIVAVKSILQKETEIVVKDLEL